MAPPILEYLGALTKKAMPDVELQLIDANITSVHSDRYRPISKVVEEVERGWPKV